MRDLNYKKLYCDWNFLEEKIVKSGDKWLVKSEDGSKVLGTHDTKEDAVDQLQAIEINKESVEDVPTVGGETDFAQKISSKNKELNMPSWAILKDGNIGRIFDMPNMQREMIISFGGKDHDISVDEVQRVVWYDVDPYQEELPQQEPVASLSRDGE